MNYRLDISGHVVREMQDYWKEEIDALRYGPQHMDTLVATHPDNDTGRECITIQVYDFHKAYGEANQILINRLMVDPYRRHGLQQQLTEFAVTVKNQLKLML